MSSCGVCRAPVYDGCFYCGECNRKWDRESDMEKQGKKELEIEQEFARLRRKILELEQRIQGRPQMSKPNYKLGGEEIE